MSQYESQYEFGSVVVKSPKLKLILDELRQVVLPVRPGLSFVIVGEAGCGKNTMAQFIQKTIYKNQDVVIERNVSQISEIKKSSVIITTSQQNWINLKGELQTETAKVIFMPTLKERKLDLIDLAEFFLKVLSLMSGRPQLKLTEKAAEMILQYNWPGQFYEFEAILESAYETALKNSSQLLLEPQHLNINKLPQTLDVNVGMKLEEIERNFILQTLYFVHQNRTKAAEILGISIRTLRNKINQYRQEGYL